MGADAPGYDLYAGLYAVLGMICQVLSTKHLVKYCPLVFNKMLPYMYDYSELAEAAGWARSEQ